MPGSCVDRQQDLCSNRQRNTAFLIILIHYPDTPLIIPFPQKGNGILLLCGFIFAIIIIGVVVVKVNSVAVKLGQISLFF